MKIELLKKKISQEIMSLLLQADPNQESIDSYICNSTILIAIEGEVIIGVGVIQKLDDKCEIKNISILDNYQTRGIGTQLVEELVNCALSMMVKTVEVGTGNSSLSQFAFYQKCNFRMHRIKIGYFDSYPTPIYENGIRCRDLVIFRRDL